MWNATDTQWKRSSGNRYVLVVQRLVFGGESVCRIGEQRLGSAKDASKRGTMRAPVGTKQRRGQHTNNRLVLLRDVYFLSRFPIADICVSYSITPYVPCTFYSHQRIHSTNLCSHEFNHYSSYPAVQWPCINTLREFTYIRF